MNVLMDAITLAKFIENKDTNDKFLDSCQQYLDGIEATADAGLWGLDRMIGGAVKDKDFKDVAELDQEKAALRDRRAKITPQSEKAAKDAFTRWNHAYDLFVQARNFVLKKKGVSLDNHEAYFYEDTLQELQSLPDLLTGGWTTLEKNFANPEEAARAKKYLEISAQAGMLEKNFANPEEAARAKKYLEISAHIAYGNTPLATLLIQEMLPIENCVKQDENRIRIPETILKPFTDPPKLERSRG